MSKLKLLLHSCCAPCSSSCLLELRKEYDVTVFFYNPNISEQEEYSLRAAEEKRLIAIYNEEALADPNLGGQINYIDGLYDNDLFLSSVKGYEDAPERGPRCAICFRLRLQRTAEVAREHGFDLFATTLTLSPLKDAALINSIGLTVGEEVGVNYLESNFKKKNGYLKSIELSKKYGLYRQDYCGCVFSKEERARAKAEREEDKC